MAEPPFVFTGVNWTGSTDLGGAAHYGTNTLWLELVQAPNPSILVLHGTEPGTYYQVLGKRHLEDEQWTIETSVLATSSNTTVTLPYFGRNPLFFMAGKDTDGDGLPDFIEDANHNGLVDAGETSFLDPDTDVDGRTDAEELLYDLTNPLNGSDAAAARLGYWRFNSSALLGQSGQVPLVNEGTQLISAWSGSALQMDSTSSVRLIYRDVEPLKGASLNCRMGSARFWFKPNWNSSNGPGATGYFLTLGNTTTNADGWWALSVNSAGDQLSFITQTNGSTTTHFNTAINWTTNAWLQVGLTWNATETKLYLNGQLAATGAGVTRWPRREARAAGFTVGGNRAGGEQMRGQLDELETFNYILSAAEISANYNQLTTATPIAIDLPGSINTNFITATLSGAMAAEMTAVVAPASLNSATWLPFAGTISATLGSTNGDYTVYFGFRTVLGTVLWTTNFITLDTVAPLITLENPPSSVVTNSLLHVHARVPESIRGDSIRSSLSSTLGVVSGAGGWADQVYDPVTFCGRCGSHLRFARLETRTGGEFFPEPLFLLADLRRRLDARHDEEIAAHPFLAEAASAHAHPLAGGRARRNLDADRAVQRGGLHVLAEHRLPRGQIQFAPQIFPLHLEVRMPRQPHAQQQVPCSTAARAGLALARHAQQLPLDHARRDFDLVIFRPGRAPGPAAGRAGHLG